MKTDKHPRVGEWWRTENGVTVQLRSYGNHGNLDCSDADDPLGACLWGPDGRGVENGDIGNLTYRVNPDGTTYVPRKEINYQRIASRMNKAKTIKEARAIYARSVKVGRA